MASSPGTAPAAVPASLDIARESRRCNAPSTTPDIEWPAYYRDSLTVGKRNAGVGICALWTPQARFAEVLDRNSFAVIGNLYSAEGINLLIRNVLANPCIRHLVLCGVDLTGTGRALTHLLKEGAQRFIGILDPSIPSAAVEEFRTGVVLHDCTGERDPRRIEALISSLPVLPPFAEPRLFPREEPYIQTFPAEAGGQIARGSSVARTWLAAQSTVLQFGRITPTESGSRQREVLNLTVVVEAEDPDNPELPVWLPVSLEMIEQYSLQVLEHSSDEGLSYTYGHRLRALRGQDQLVGMARELERCADSRRAVAVLWDPEQDLTHGQPPCLISVQARLREDGLHLLAYLRSSDVCRAWPLNAFALCRMQARLARHLGVSQLGPVTTIAGSAHIYEESWPAATRLLRDHYPEQKSRFIRDPRGSFAIRVVPPDIQVDHYAPGGQWLATHRGRKVEELERAISPYVSLPGHAMYLGRQLALAELALRQGMAYTQDATVASA